MTRPREYLSSSACHARQTGALAEELGGLLAAWAAEAGVWPADLGLAQIKRPGRQHRPELLVFDRRDLPDVRAWTEDRLGERLAQFAEMSPEVPIVTRQDLALPEPVETPTAAEAPVEVLEVAGQDLDPAEPEPVAVLVPVASAVVAQALAPTVLASSRPIVIAAAWGQANGAATVAGRAFATVPLVIGCGPMRAHHVPARRVFACSPCPQVETVPAAWMTPPIGDGVAMGLG